MYSRNCITYMQPIMAETKRLGQGWHTITGHGPVDPSERLLNLVKRIVPAYLRDLCARQLKVEQSVPEDLFAFANRYGAAVPLEAVQQHLYLANDAGDADAFADIVSRLMIAGKFRVALEGFEVPEDLVRSAKGLQVPHYQLSQLLAKQSISLPDRTRINTVLTHAGVLRATTMDGWDVDREWWERQYAKITSRPDPCPSGV